ncbi:hypothetical protein NS2_00920 [Nocardia seriolae NBRC 15557]|nr:hypothetical protein NS2_00920 [Nocardia seriolae NBRC 15557]
MACTVNSVGPYRLCSSAELTLRKARTTSEVNASPAISSARNEDSCSAAAPLANTLSMDGTNEVMVTPSAAMTSARYCGSRCPSGVATTMRAPTASVPNSSHTDTSKVCGVFSSTTSSAERPYSEVIHAIWLTAAACGTATPFGRPVEPEVKMT